jgi:hypothetical protein
MFVKNQTKCTYGEFSTQGPATQHLQLLSHDDDKDILYRQSLDPNVKSPSDANIKGSGFKPPIRQSPHVLKTKAYDSGSTLT